MDTSDNSNSDELPQSASPQNPAEIHPAESQPAEELPGVSSPQPSLMAEFLEFLKHNKKWWLLPLLLSLLVLGLLVFLSGSGALVFLYPLG